MRQPKPWYRKSTRSWYVQIGRKQVRLGRDKETAWAKYYELMSVTRGAEPEGKITVATLVALYLAWCEKNPAPSTYEKNRLHLRGFVTRVPKTAVIVDLKPHHVHQWIDARYAGLSNTYKHTAITVLKAAMNWAVDQGYIDHSPIARVKKPQPAIRDFFVRSIDWPRLVAAARGQAFTDFVTVMLSTGARPQELRHVEASHFDRELRRLDFPRDESKGKRSQRAVYLDDVAYQIVERLAAQRPKGPIFRNSRGRPWTRHAIGGRFRRLRARLDMPKLCAYSLRHSHAHWRVITGTDSYVLTLLLGHADGRMLETRYGHVEQDAAFMLAAARRTPSPLE
jgi:integrase